MRRRNFIVSALPAAVLCACAGSPKGIVSSVPFSARESVSAKSTSPPGSLAFLRNSGSDATVSFSTVYSFKNAPDGGGVQAKMTKVGGVLYGTSHGGGANGYGSIFKFDPVDGVEKVIYSFKDGLDGWGPEALLQYVNGTFYGTASSVPEPGFPDGQGNGSVFAISPLGAFHVLHTFAGAPDGANPEGFVISVNGTLYGTTFVGGTGTCGYSESQGCGTVFNIDPKTGAEQTIYSFKGGSDGAGPRSGLVDLNGTLYGVTYYGGANDDGTVFSITTGGAENVLYSFKGGADGSHPQSALTPLNGTLYGTTNQGGSTGYGTVYSITTQGAESIVYPVCCGPEGGLIPVNGVLYGTTSDNGSSSGGTVFSVTVGGAYQTLHEFHGGSGGGSPEATITNINGTFYGTTRLAGGHGVGTIFKLRP